jgi:hypothetical protein
MQNLTTTTLSPDLVASWETTAGQYLAAKPSITDAVTFNASTAWVAAAKKEVAALTDMRIAVTRNLDAAKKAIMEREKEIAKPLADAIADVLAQQTAYRLEQERIAAEAECVAAEARERIACTGQAAQDAANAIVKRITEWATTEEADKGVKALPTWKPKAPADVDADLFAAKFEEQRPRLLEYAAQRQLAITAGAAPDVVAPPVVQVSTALEQLDTMAEAPTVVLKGATKVLVPVVAWPCDVLTLANLASQAGYDVLADLQKWASKIPKRSTVAGVTWREEFRQTNKA